MEQLEVGVMWNWRKCEVCGIAEYLKYAEPKAVSARYMEVQSVFTVCNYRHFILRQTKASAQYLELQAV